MQFHIIVLRYFVSESHNNDKNSFNPAAENNNKDSEQSWSYTSISGSNTANYQDNANTWGKDTGNTWTENTSAGNANKDNWESGSSGQSSGNKNDIWGAKDGVGESSSKCSGPLCPGNSGKTTKIFYISFTQFFFLINNLTCFKIPALISFIR